jgi:protein-disulfide isomerase
VQSSKQSASNRAFYLLIAAVAIGGIAWLTYQSTRSREVVQASPIDTTLPKVESQGYVLGSPTARLEVTEFGDFECPACGHFATLTEPDIRKKFVSSGLVRWRFVDYPLPVHRNTWQASRAAACADEQKRFWDFHDYLYQTQDQWNGEVTDNPDKFMRQAGRQLGLDAAKFDQCVDSKKYQAKIQAHLALGEGRKINQTPTFIIGSRQFAQVMTYDQMAKVISDELAKLPPAPATGGDSSKSVPLAPATKKPE